MDEPPLDAEERAWLAELVDGLPPEGVEALAVLLGIDPSGL